MSKRNKIITNNISNNVNKKVPNEAMEDGIYRNARAAHVAASLIGCLVQVRVKNGTTYDGILTTISPEMTIVLETAHKSNENGSNVSLPLTKDTVIIDTIVINWPDIVSMTALNVDLGYASKESFATDTAISGRSNGQSAKMRDLQPFECDGPSVGGLEDGQNGWSPDDMFQTNESKFTIQSSFNQDLSQYTTPLPNVNSSDYREKNERAERLAMEIEGGDTHRTRAQLENGGEDEEMAFSAVHRNQRSRNNHQNSNNPQWRRGAGAANVNGGSRMGSRGGANVSGFGRDGGGPGPAPMPRQTLPPVQLGGQALPPRSAAGSSQPPFPSAHQMPQPQISLKSGGFGQQQDRSADSGVYSQQQQERNLPHDARSPTEYNRQSSTGSDGRNHVPLSSHSRPSGNHNEFKVTGPPAGMPASADGRSPQSGGARDVRKPGEMPSPVDKASSGVDKSPKQAPWGSNQQQSQPMPPRSEPLPPRSQVAPPASSAPRTQPPEQKSLQQKDDEAKKLESLQEFGKSLNIQYDSNQSKDAKTSLRPSVQPVAGQSPPRAESESAGHDNQSLAQKSTPAEQVTIAKHSSDELSPAPKSEDTDKALVGKDDDDSADKKKPIAKTSTLNPNAKEFTLNPNAKEFNPTKMFQPGKPVTSPTPPRVVPGMAPPTPVAAPPQLLVPANYIPVQSYPVAPMILPGAPQMRPMQGNNKRVSRMDQAQAATGQPLIAPQSAQYNIIPLMPQSAVPQVIPARLLDPSQMSAQQPSGQQPFPVIVNQPGVPMTQQHSVGGQPQVAANPQMNPPPPPPGAGGQQGGAHPSPSPVQQPQQAGPMQPPQTPTSVTPQPTQPPPQLYYSHQQQPGQGPQQMMATVQSTPPSPQQPHAVFPPQHFNALQQQLGHLGAGTAYQFAPGGPQQFQVPLHIAGTPGAGAPHGVMQMASLQHPHMTQPAHVFMSQPVPGQLHPAQMQAVMGQGALAHPGIPGSLPNQPAQLANIGPQGFVTAQPMGYYPVPYLAQPGSFHPTGHVIPSGMQFHSTQ